MLTVLVYLHMGLHPPIHEADNILLRIDDFTKALSKEAHLAAALRTISDENHISDLVNMSICCF